METDHGTNNIPHTCCIDTQKPKAKASDVLNFNNKLEEKKKTAPKRLSVLVVSYAFVHPGALKIAIGVPSNPTGA